MREAEKTRFDIRLSKEQKEFFEYAATLGGFRTLTEFVVFSGQQQADKIVEKHNAILASKKDQTIFFDAITNPPKPNAQLRKAAERFKKIINDK